MRILRWAVALILGVGISVPALAQKTEQHKIVFGGAQRTYLLYPAAPGSEPAPLLLLLHGSGRDAASIFDLWQPLAKKERIVLVAPDAFNRAGWSTATDGPDFMRQIIDEVTVGGGIDKRRMYIFGHSAGGHHAIDLGLLESEYFAAVAVHAGVLIEPGAILPMADRKIPVSMWNGLDDPTVPIAAARSTLKTLTAGGFPASLVEIPAHTHDYYGLAGQVNKEAWQMLKTVTLPADPKFKSYSIR
jgi:poly(3-hydroxybutyrate) depolymerase